LVFLLLYFETIKGLSNNFRKDKYFIYFYIIKILLDNFGKDKYLGFISEIFIR